MTESLLTSTIMRTICTTLPTARDSATVSRIKLSMTNGCLIVLPVGVESFLGTLTPSSKDFAPHPSHLPVGPIQLTAHHLAGSVVSTRKRAPWWRISPSPIPQCCRVLQSETDQCSRRLIAEAGVLWGTDGRGASTESSRAASAFRRAWRVPDQTLPYRRRYRRWFLVLF